MFEDVGCLVQKVVTSHVRTGAQSVPSLVLSVHLGVGGTCSFERSQSRRQAVCLAEVEQWLVVVEGALGVSLVGVVK